MILAITTFIAVISFGGQIKSWMDLLERKASTSKEDELRRNIDIKRRIENDFTDWLNYTPENRKRNSKMLLRAFDGHQYPDINEPDKYGEYSWFAAGFKGIYHNGVEFFMEVKELVMLQDNQWDFYNNRECENSDTITACRVGRSNYSDIVVYDLEGDEHYPVPHFFCKFKYKGSPFEETYYTSIDDKLSYLCFEFKDKRH